jgi:hypothetical protein
VVLGNNWTFIVIGVTKIGTPYIKVKYFFIYFWFRENMKVCLTSGSRHRGFVVLVNDWTFIVIGVTKIGTPYITVKYFLYIFGFVKI